MSIILEVPDTYTATEAQRELALVLFRDGKVSCGYAAEMAGIDRWDFAELCNARGIPFPMSEEEMLKDVENALRHR